MDLGLRGKTILITGASDGFGRALALVLAEEGADLALHDIDLPHTRTKLQALAGQLRSERGIQARTFYADLLRPEEAEALVGGAAEWRPLYGLVNNAAVWPTSTVRDMETAQVTRTLAINLVAPFALCRGMVNHLLADGRPGRIVNMVSQAAFYGSTSGHADYAASKAGLVGLTVSLAREVAGDGILVNCVAPGMMRTPMNRQTLAEREGDYLRRIPLGRIADPTEVAWSVAFLLGGQAGYITGATLDVTGGMLMR